MHFRMEVVVVLCLWWVFNEKLRDRIDWQIVPVQLCFSRGIAELFFYGYLWLKEGNLVEI